MYVFIKVEWQYLIFNFFLLRHQNFQNVFPLKNEKKGHVKAALMCYICKND